MENRNLLLAIVLSVGILLLWSAIFEAPERQVPISNQAQTQESSTDRLKMDLESYEFEAQENNKTNTISLDDSLKKSNRVIIATPSLTGSINLEGLTRLAF